MLIFFIFVLILIMKFSTRRVSLNKLFLICYFIFFVLPILVVYDLNISLETELYLIVAFTCFYIGYFFVYMFPARSSVGTSEASNLIKGFRVNRLVRAKKFVFPLFFSFIVVFELHLRSNGLSYTVFFDGFFAVVHSYIKLRYSGDLNVSLWTVLSLVFAFTLSFIAGFLSSRLHLTKTKIFVSLLPAITLTLLLGTKGILLSAFFMFVGGWFIGMNQNYRYFPNIDLSTIYKLFLYGTLLLSIVVVTFYSKGIYNRSETSVLGEVAFKFLSYFSTHLYAFDDWLNWYFGQSSLSEYSNSPLPVGSRTFWPLVELINAVELKGFRAGYDDVVYFENGLKTNLYSVFRGLIEDFGILGSFIFMVCIGLVTGICDRRNISNNDIGVVTSLSLVWFYSNMFAISAFAWSTTYVFLVFIYLILRTTKVKHI